MAKLRSVLVKKYLICIRKALRNVEFDYIRIPAKHSKRGRLNERVFCYELYHQLSLVIQTSQLSKLTPRKIKLHGELSKGTYPYFPNESPDFLIHKPKTNSFNLIVIQVKPNLYCFDKVIADFEKLCRFIRDNFYKLGIFIVYDSSFSQLQTKFEQLNGTELEDFKRKFNALNNAAKSVVIMCIKNSKTKKHIKSHFLFSEILERVLQNN